MTLRGLERSLPALPAEVRYDVAGACHALRDRLATGERFRVALRAVVAQDWHRDPLERARQLDAFRALTGR